MCDTKFENFIRLNNCNKPNSGSLDISNQKIVRVNGGRDSHFYFPYSDNTNHDALNNYFTMAILPWVFPTEINKCKYFFPDRGM